MKNWHLYILIFLTLASCRKEEEEIPAAVPIPEVNTLEAVILGNHEAVLYGDYKTHDDNTVQLGFEYAVDSLFMTDVITFTHNIIIHDNIFSYKIDSGIEIGTRYYYRAFIQTSTNTHFGYTENFVSDGSIPPRIDSISNDYGHIGDIIEIYGDNFIVAPFFTRVDFSYVEAEVILLRDTLIRCKVPLNINSSNPDIRVKVTINAGIYSSFNLFAPLINTIEPCEAVIGDTITILGDHFDINNDRNEVYFGNIQANILESNRNSIKAVIPIEIESPSFIVKVKAQLQEVNYDQEFTLSAPEIISFSPSKATFRDEITINGNNFDYELSRNKVFFGNIESTIVYADRHKLVAVLPDDLESASEQIKVIAQFQEVTFNENFELIPPEINFVPQDVFVNQDIEIQGSWFHPIINKNTVTIEDIDVAIFSGSTGSLNTTIPWGPFPRRKAIVKVQVLDLIAEYEIDLNIMDKWIMVSDELPFRYSRHVNNAVVANNTAYIISYPKDIFNDQLYLWELNPDDYSWQQSSIPFSMKGTGIATSNGDKIFVYSARSENGFWEYDPLYQQWTQLSPFPGERRDWPTHFSINGNIYLGMGADFEPYTAIPYGDFYKYSPTTNNWSAIAEFTYHNYFVRTETATFVLNDIGYVGNGASNTGMKDFWSYDPNVDEWIRIADFPYAEHYTTGFSLDGFGYIAGVGTGYESWRYDPGSNTWEQSYDIGKPRGGHFSFSLNGKAYIGGGGSPVGSSTSYELFEFMP